MIKTIQMGKYILDTYTYDDKVYRRNIGIVRPKDNTYFFTTKHGDKYKISYFDSNAVAVYDACIFYPEVNYFADIELFDSKYKAARFMAENIDRFL